MAVKAVFFDIDGTLLNNSKRVEKSTLLAINRLKEQGILVGLATGRGPAFVAPFVENLGLDMVVAYNGQYVFTRDDIIYEQQLPKKLLYKLIRYASEQKREISLGTASGLLGSGLIGMGTSFIGQWVSRLVPKKMSKMVEKTFKHLIRRFKPQNIEALKTLVREPVYQVVLVATKGESAKLATRFPQVDITRSSPYSIDLISQGQSKLKGIARLGEIFDFTLSEVMAFGDSENDLDMVEGVGLGIAMGNAISDLKTIADYVTASNNQEGISKALAHYGLIHIETDQGFKSRDENFNHVRDFHLLMDGQLNRTPKLFSLADASHRADFKIEEIVEFLYAASQGNQQHFTQAISDLHQALDKAAKKVQKKAKSESPLVGEVDALLDLLYLTYGSFVLMGVDPQPLFSSVHTANMGKRFPDGKAHFDPVTHKILKPADWEKRFAPEPALRQELDRQIQRSL